VHGEKGSSSSSSAVEERVRRSAGGVRGQRVTDCSGERCGKDRQREENEKESERRRQRDRERERRGSAYTDQERRRPRVNERASERERCTGDGIVQRNERDEEKGVEGGNRGLSRLAARGVRGGALVSLRRSDATGVF